VHHFRSSRKHFNASTNVAGISGQRVLPSLLLLPTLEKEALIYVPEKGKRNRLIKRFFPDLSLLLLLAATAASAGLLLPRPLYLGECQAVYVCGVRSSSQPILHSPLLLSATASSLLWLAGKTVSGPFLNETERSWHRPENSRRD
jgi:hypothetical protein